MVRLYDLEIIIHVYMSIRRRKAGKTRLYASTLLKKAAALEPGINCKQCDNLRKESDELKADIEDLKFIQSQLQNKNSDLQDEIERLRRTLSEQHHSNNPETTSQACQTEPTPALAQASAPAPAVASPQPNAVQSRATQTTFEFKEENVVEQTIKKKNNNKKKPSKRKGGSKLSKYAGDSKHLMSDKKLLGLIYDIFEKKLEADNVDDRQQNKRAGMSAFVQQ